MRAYAIIPARSGSKGLPNKNILEIDGHPLLAYSVAFAKRLNVEKVVVSSDSREYLSIGKRYGADTLVHRGAEASGDTAMEEAILADYVAQSYPPPDFWVWLKPTAPFRSLLSVNLALQTLRESPLVSAIRIVSEADARLHTIGADGLLRPLLDWPAGRSKIRRTEVPKTYKPFNLEVFRHENWEKYSAGFMGDVIYPIVDAKFTGLDIDDHYDFLVVKALIEAKPEFLKQYVHL